MTMFDMSPSADALATAGDDLWACDFEGALLRGLKGVSAAPGSPRAASNSRAPVKARLRGPAKSLGTAPAAGSPTLQQKFEFAAEQVDAYLTANPEGKALLVVAAKKVKQCAHFLQEHCSATLRLRHCADPAGDLSTAERWGASVATHNVLVASSSAIGDVRRDGAVLQLEPFGLLLVDYDFNRDVHHYQPAFVYLFEKWASLPETARPKFIDLFSLRAEPAALAAHRSKMGGPANTQTQPLKLPPTPGTVRLPAQVGPALPLRLHIPRPSVSALPQAVPVGNPNPQMVQVGAPVINVPLPVNRRANSLPDWALPGVSGMALPTGMPLPQQRSQSLPMPPCGIYLPAQAGQAPIALHVPRSPPTSPLAPSPTAPPAPAFTFPGCPAAAPAPAPAADPKELLAELKRGLGVMLTYKTGRLMDGTYQSTLYMRRGDEFFSFEGAVTHEKRAAEQSAAQNAIDFLCGVPRPNSPQSSTSSPKSVQAPAPFAGPATHLQVPPASWPAPPAAAPLPLEDMVRLYIGANAPYAPVTVVPTTGPAVAAPGGRLSPASDVSTGSSVRVLLRGE